MRREETTSSASRVSALTGLRGLAAASVVVFHVWQYGAANGVRFTAGPFGRVFASLDIGVTFFFVLSGLLLYRPYARALLAGRAWPQLRNFAVARFLRIVPVYWAAVLVVAASAERWLFHHPWRLLANLCFAEFAIPSFYTDDLGVDNGSIV
ncbi:MAG TPA: acyltransferase family protein, partial [Gaiellaceae bacterium]|nr:acyltransferase family protein [Gaiellaceae bacterium]